VLLTSIEEVATRLDLLDRCLIDWLPTIPEDSRRPEAELIDAFKMARPRILGAILNAVTGALRDFPNATLADLPRMADFALWVTAAETALGWQSVTFLSAYRGNLKSAKQFTRWLLHDRRALVDPLAHLSKLNVSTDRRHDRQALFIEEFTLLIEAAHYGKPIETISGPDRVMMYVLAAWTGFRKGEIGSLTLRSLRLDDDPATATVAACFCKRKRQDTQILHSDVVRRLKEWLATKEDQGVEDLLFPVSRRVPGSTGRKTHKLMRLHLEAARTRWINDADTPEK
jgi:integrase